VCPGSIASYLAKLLLVPVLDIQGHSLSSHQILYSFVNSYLDNNFSGILQHEADVLTCYFNQGYFRED
jgi:hypothetical protein